MNIYDPSEVIYLDSYRDSKLPHVLSEVICIKCRSRWIAVRPANTLLKDIECNNCGPGFVIETGQNLDDISCSDAP